MTLASNWCILNWRDFRRVQMAMWAHHSQMVWFRRLYIIFSRYMIINTLREVQISDAELEIQIASLQKTDWIAPSWSIWFSIDTKAESKKRNTKQIERKKEGKRESRAKWNAFYHLNKNRLAIAGFNGNHLSMLLFRICCRHLRQKQRDGDRQLPSGNVTNNGYANEKWMEIAKVIHWIVQSSPLTQLTFHLYFFVFLYFLIWALARFISIT